MRRPSRPSRPLLAMLLCHAAFPTRARIVPLARRAAAALSLEEFDREFLDQRPLILTGVSICPKATRLDNVHEHCHGTKIHSACLPGLTMGLTDCADGRAFRPVTQGQCLCAVTAAFFTETMSQCFDPPLVRRRDVGWY
jgi:hypothetical protein